MEQKKILNAFFEEELVEEVAIKKQQKKDISLVTQEPLEKINMIMKQFIQYQKMHHLLRSMKERN